MNASTLSLQYIMYRDKHSTSPSKACDFIPLKFDFRLFPHSRSSRECWSSKLNIWNFLLWSATGHPLLWQTYAHTDINIASKHHQSLIRTFVFHSQQKSLFRELIWTFAWVLFYRDLSCMFWGKITSATFGWKKPNLRIVWAWFCRRHRAPMIEFCLHKHFTWDISASSRLQRPKFKNCTSLVAVEKCLLDCL